MKVNSFSLFGDRKKWSSGFSTNIRQHFTFYSDPSWVFWIHTDRELDNEGYCPVLRELAEKNLIRVTVVKDEGLYYQRRLKCTMMLWRLLPLWEESEFVFCRDIDSILTPRQLQCVRSFISSGKAVHGINDNNSHVIPLMGGMCGFRTKKFKEIFNYNSLNDMLLNGYQESGPTIYGYDQDFLMRFIWPRAIDSSRIHKLEGPNDRSANKIVAEAYMEDIPRIVRDVGDNFTNYIGAVGCNTSRGSYSDREIADFFNEHGNREKCEIITEIESRFGWR